MENTITERRRTPRIDLRGHAVVIALRASVRLLDMCVNGVRLTVADDVDVGTRVWLTAVLAGEPLSAAARVQRAPWAHAKRRGPGAIVVRLRNDRTTQATVERFLNREP